MSQPELAGEPGSSSGTFAASVGSSTSKVTGSFGAGDEPSTASPSRPFIQRPVATALLMVAIVLAGLVGFKFLPLSALPQVD